MKKQLLITLLLLNSIFLNAQNFRTINVGDTAHFSYSPYVSGTATNIRSIFVDSSATAGTDLEIFGYKAIEFDSLFCYPLTRTTWLGKKIVQAANGYDYYLMGVSDTVSVNTLANVTDTWHFYNYSNGDYIEATLITLTVESFLGITDNVKTLQLQAKNSGGTPIVNALNGYQLKFSENYGWTKTLSYKNFPSDTTMYFIVGHTNIATGYSNFGATEIFNFDVGDEFHYHYYCRSSISEYWESFSTTKILSKSASLNGDTLFYTDSSYVYNYHKNGLSITTWADSSIVNDFFILSDYPYLNNISNQLLFDTTSMPFPDNGYLNVLTDTSYYSRNRKTVVPCLSMYYPNCFSPSIDCAWRDDFIVGLGLALRDNGFWYPCYDSLIYYNKSGQTWGQKINWQQLLSVNKIQSNSLSLQVFPNPVDDAIKIKSETVIVNAKVEIKDITGKLIYSTFISTDENEIAVPFKNAAKGIYFLTVSSEKGNTNFKLVK